MSPPPPMLCSILLLSLLAGNFLRFPLYILLTTTVARPTSIPPDNHVTLPQKSSEPLPPHPPPRVR